MTDINPSRENALPVQPSMPSVVNSSEAKNPWGSFLCFEKMHPDAIVPIKEPDNAGYDLFSFDMLHIPPRSSALVNTQIKMRMPPGVYGRIASRSGLAVNFNIEVGAGVIDRGYRGDIKVLLRNHSDNTYSIAKGDKIAQLILTHYANVPIKEVRSLNDIFGATGRGVKGFGSSGK